MCAHSLDPIFKPKSIAVIGATPRRGTIGHQLLDNMIQFGFNGMVFPVNPNYPFIKSIKCYPSVLAIPDPVDLAIIVVRKDHVLKVAEQCGDKGVKGLIIISAGFREVGGKGIAREEALSALKQRFGFRIVGPNCMGVINANPDVRMNGTFAAQEPSSGPLAFMTQSGALGVAIVLLAHRFNIGLSSFVSVGNKVDVSGNDLLEYWGQDEHTGVIGLYLESFGAPGRFTQLSKRITKTKPIILVKSGTTPAGSRAASSHTGHLAGLDIAVDGLLQQCGVLRVSTIQELMDLALAFTKAPILRGDRIAIVTNAGGPGIMATDALVNAGLSMAEFSDKTRAALTEMLPEESSVRNPVDMIAGADADTYERSVDLVLADEGVDAAIVIFVPPIMVEPRAVVEGVTLAMGRHSKPVFSVLMAEERFYEELPREIPDAPPMYRFPEDAVRSIAHMVRYRDWCERPEGEVCTFDVKSSGARQIVEDAVATGGGYIAPMEVNRVLKDYGFPVCGLEIVGRDESPVEAGERVGYPVVLKAYGSHIIHKSDFGGVAIDVRDEEQLEAAHAAMVDKLKREGLHKDVEGFMVQEMAAPGKEIILGMTMDEKFGPVLMFGMGGKYVEIIRDIAFRVMPVTDLDAWEMVRGIKSYPLLEGVRGEERVDIEFIVESIQRLAQLVCDVPEIVELDINPVIVGPDRARCRVVDARIRVGG